MSTTNPEQHPTTPPDCSICLEPRFPSTSVALVPCTHAFDLSCIHHYLTKPVRSTADRKCPLCRQPITAIKYNFAASGSCDTYTFGPNQAEPHLLSGPFIAVDEEIRIDMTPAQKARVIELRRLRRIEDYVDQYFCLRLERVWYLSTKGDEIKVVLAQNFIMLTVRQSNTPRTMTRLGRLNIVETFIKDDAEALEKDLGPQNPRAVERIKREIEEVDGMMRIPREGGNKELFERPMFKIDRRGVRCSVNTRMNFTRTNHWEGGESLMFERTTDLCEEYKAEPLCTLDDDDLFPESVGGIGGGETIRLVREEIQGILETIALVKPDWRGLERAITGIMEPVPAGRETGCEYCGKWHRNGDCQLEPGVTLIENLHEL
ncbi:hypothetical protein L207DRAFT_628817 [Hyaloscypha variabilis F]|uniref:RING-type domain-containing protein n=1 Tax=Hyaloscypha variabilis (strain UAMH 11265 / GT02V1 / F) TaxID=1149755 RepID=A0A2J6S653_HYAVF|nr:hypothetical protein L207DRAFT_628817 [Hyaloscypha variabilis F]